MTRPGDRLGIIDSDILGSHGDDADDHIVVARNIRGDNSNRDASGRGDNNLGGSYIADQH